MTESLFDHLVGRFDISSENLAMKTLCYILDRSQITHETFLTFLSDLQFTIQAHLNYETQVRSPKGTLPGLVGKN